MHTTSVAAMKRQTASRPRRDRPHPNTKIGQVYDYFQANKGKVVPYIQGNTRGTTMSQLIDVYGLDIRRMGHKQYALVGEWFGKVYIDYLATPASEEKQHAPF
jgi:hypothetical protein